MLRLEEGWGLYQPIITLHASLTHGCFSFTFSGKFPPDWEKDGKANRPQKASFHDCRTKESRAHLHTVATPLSGAARDFSTTESGTSSSATRGEPDPCDSAQDSGHLEEGQFCMFYSQCKWLRWLVYIDFPSRDCFLSEIWNWTFIY